MGPMHESTREGEFLRQLKARRHGIVRGWIRGNVIGKVEACFDTNYKEVDISRYTKKFLNPEVAPICGGAN